MLKRFVSSPKKLGTFMSGVQPQLKGIPSNAVVVGTHLSLVSRNQNFHTSQKVNGGGGGSSNEEQYCDDIGAPFGIPRHKKYKLEGWEFSYFAFFIAPFVLFTILLAYKPDHSIRAWAKEEVKRRHKTIAQEAEHILTVEQFNIEDDSPSEDAKEFYRRIVPLGEKPPSGMMEKLEEMKALAKGMPIDLDEQKRKDEESEQKKVRITAMLKEKKELLANDPDSPFISRISDLLSKEQKERLDKRSFKDEVHPYWKELADHAERRDRNYLHNAPPNLQRTSDSKFVRWLGHFFFSQPPLEEHEKQESRPGVPREGLPPTLTR